MKRYRKCFAHLLCLAVLASGCGGGGRSGSNSNSRDAGEDKEIIAATELVTKEDAERILGVPVRLGSKDLSERNSSCFYGGTNVEKGNPSSLSANLLLNPTEDLAKTSFETLSKQGDRMGSVEPIAGLGDEAQLASGSPATFMIFIRKKRTVFYLTAVGNAEAKPSLSEMRAVALRVSQKL